MLRLFFNAVALFTLTLAAGVVWQDFTRIDAPSVQLGQIWFDMAPHSLQLSQSVVERYIDPCGLIMALGCSPFLWYPLIASLLQWPAALVFGILAFVFALIARLFPPMRRGRRRYRRDGL